MGPILIGPNELTPIWVPITGYVICLSICAWMMVFG